MAAAACEGRFNVIERLDNNEQILLLYLADELPDDDRADVDRMLADDPSLRRHLSEVQGNQAFVLDELARLDVLSPLPVSAESAARQVGRLMRQQLARPTAPAAVAVAGGERRSWWWLYPTVAAASVLIVAMLWLQRQNGPSSMPGPVPNMSSGDLADNRSPSPTPSPGPTVVSNSHEDDAMLLDSLKMDEQPTARASFEDDPKRLPQDEVSQYLMSATIAQQ